MGLEGQSEGGEDEQLSFLLIFHILEFYKVNQSLNQPFKGLMLEAEAQIHNREQVATKIITEYRIIHKQSTFKY